MSMSSDYIELYLKTKENALGMSHLLTGKDGITRYRYYKLNGQYLPELFKKARTRLLL